MDQLSGQWVLWTVTLSGNGPENWNILMQLVSQGSAWYGCSANICQVDKTLATAGVASSSLAPTEWGREGIMQAEVGPAVGVQPIRKQGGAQRRPWVIVGNAKFRFSHYLFLIAMDFPRTEKPQLGWPLFPYWRLGWGGESLAANSTLKLPLRALEALCHVACV